MFYINKEVTRVFTLGPVISFGNAKPEQRSTH